MKAAFMKAALMKAVGIQILGSQCTGTIHRHSFFHVNLNVQGSYIGIHVFDVNLTAHLPVCLDVHTDPTHCPNKPKHRNHDVAKGYEVVKQA